MTAQEQPIVPASCSSGDTSLDGPGPSARLLVCDDESTVRDLLCDLLTWLGYEVDTAVDGPEGLALLDHGRYDLVLTDLEMPGMTGWEVADAVQQTAPGTGVIVITGSATYLDFERARERNLTLLLKPLHVEELKTAVVDALRERRETREAHPSPRELLQRDPRR